MITVNEFAKMEIKVGLVVKAEDVEASRKLIRAEKNQRQAVVYFCPGSAVRGESQVTVLKSVHG
ncbi:MAG: hypothetical protein U1C50_03135 [Patescibacteria group bacterium]|nr:hypothetical protein [Patescibacteria group bacterium]